MGRPRDRRRREAHHQRCAEYKGQVCQVCGRWYDCQQVLEYHHLVPELKAHDISNLRSRPWEEVKAELDKCVVLCANCHREVHAGYTNLEDYL